MRPIHIINYLSMLKSYDEGELSSCLRLLALGDALS